jgi:alpha-mannosidase
MLFSRSSHSHIPEVARVAIYLVLIWPAAIWAQRSDAVEQFDIYAPRQTEAAVKALSPQSQAVLSRLAKLKSFPLTRWKYHKGDVEQGAGIDDSSWQEISVPYSTGTNDVVWVRKAIEVPKSLDGYDLTGARIWIDFGGDDKLTAYLNGRRVAEGENLEPILLFDSAKPGDQARVAYKMWDIHLDERFDPDDVKEVPEISATVDFAPNRPDPVDLYSEFVTAALMVPVLSKDVSADRGLLENAIGIVDLQALQSGDGQKFDQSLRHAQQELEPLKPLLQTATFHMTGNSHIDSAWLWPWTETVDVVRRTFGTAVQLMSEYPTYTYTQSAAQYNEWIADKYPDINSQIKQRVAEGRWELVGGMWVEPDLNMPDGESLVRQLLIGKRTFKQLYGADVRIGWNPDSFGYNWQLPQIYKKSGIDYFATQKLGANETNPLPFKLFWWESPDGSKVLSYLPHHYDNRDLSPIRLANDFLKSRSLAPGLPEFMDLYGVGDHGGGPTRALLDQGVHWTAADKVVPKMTFGTAQAFFSDVETRFSPDSPTWNYALLAQGARPLATPPSGQISIPTWKDELYFEHHRGTYTTQANQKRHMRESEEWLLNAEKYSSLAWIGGQTYPGADLTEAWKKALFNQFHDLAAGSGLGVIYKDAEKDYDQVRWATDVVSTTALHSIDDRINTEGLGEPIVLWNPLGWSRGGVVGVNVQMPKAAPGGVSILDANGHVLPSEIVSSDPQANTYHLLVKARDVPSLGYSVLHVVPGKRSFSSDLHVNGWTMENTYLKLTVDPHTGCITSLYDKRAEFESLSADACGNQLQTFQDKPQNDDAWNIDPGTFDHPAPITQVTSVELVDKGPLRGAIRVTRKWQSSTFVQEIILYTESDEVEIVNDVDWHETHVLLKAAFPLAAGSKAATYEIPYGTIERPTTRDNSWEQAKFEVPALRWADLGDGKHGFSLINESKYGYDCEGNLLRLSLLRSPIWPDPDADRGHHHFSYALYPHDGDWKSALTVRHGYEYNYKLNALQVQSHTGVLPSTHSFVSVEPQNLVLTAMKKAEDSDALIFRFYEWAGIPTSATIHVPSGAGSATLTNLMERPEGQALEIKGSDQITVPAKPYSIVSVQVNYAHAAQGN